jgi:tellurite resistance protein TerC
VCAILGLRSLFFLVASLMEKFHLLKVGLSIILCFVGGKMLATYFDIKLPEVISLGIIVLILGASVGASLLWPKQPEREPGPGGSEPKAPEPGRDGERIGM